MGRFQYVRQVVRAVEPQWSGYTGFHAENSIQLHLFGALLLEALTMECGGLVAGAYQPEPIDLRSIGFGAARMPELGQLLQRVGDGGADVSHPG